MNIEDLDFFLLKKNIEQAIKKTKSNSNLLAINILRSGYKF